MSRGLLPWAAVVVAGALAAGCGEEPEAREGGPLGPNAALQTATCRDWLRASQDQRSTTVDRLEEIAAGPRGEGGTLPDALGYDTLDARCRPGFARGFLLYELYNRAAAFRSLAERPG